VPLIAENPKLEPSVKEEFGNMDKADSEREELEHSATIDELETRQTNERLGDVRLRHAETHEVILIPTPTNDPNDPLNW
jgi:hypothetical protein